MSLEKLKLSKGLVATMTGAGYLSPKEVQLKTLSRIIGGQDIIAVGPEGCGKTTAYILGTLMKVKYETDEAPQVLILVPDKEHGDRVLGSFNVLGKNRNLRITLLTGHGGMESEINDMMEGTVWLSNLFHLLV
ncbi:MAG: DEAD/DEAH box helicase [Pedobacter sp.]|nr:MAG: DEAD/DEAH box helicase [Pedobacter sp.]